MTAQTDKPSTTNRRARAWLIIGGLAILCTCVAVATSLSQSDDQDASAPPLTRPLSDTVEETLTPRVSHTSAPTRTPTATPTTTPTSTPTTIPTADTSACQLGAAYVADVTIPDNMSVEISSSFDKVWRVRNTGTCEWGAGYALAYVGGDALGEGLPVGVPETAAGSEVDVSVPLRAPEEPGRYRGEWQLCVNDSEYFGQKLSVVVVAVPPPSPTPRPTRMPTATPFPTTAGMTRWLTHHGQRVGVKDIAWSTSLGYFRAEAGHIYLSLYIIAVNTGEDTETFRPLDFSVVDGGGEITSGVVFGEKEPTFNACTVRPGGVCEGWWTTMIWNRPEVRSNLTLRWSPGWFVPTQETRIEQD